MPTLAPARFVDSPSRSVSASTLAQQNWMRNHQALSRNQPNTAAILGSIEPADLEWVYARDGTLTAIEPSGRWWGDCSVPLLAGRVLLKTLQAGPAGSCVLLPGNAGLLTAARERIGTCTPLFVIQPDVRIARMIFTCGDFSSQIDRHRLWTCTGPDWAQQLREIFAEHPGLATPMQFIRTRLAAEEVIAPLITAAQDVFSSVLTERTAQIAELNAHPAERDPDRILLIGGTEFRLWDQGTSVLNDQLRQHSSGLGLRIHPFDTDDPMNGAPIALLGAANDCGAIVSANICRADSNQILPHEIPWISWMTIAGAPPFATAGPRDALILADPAWRSIARQAGWPDDRVKVCGWPVAGSIAAQSEAARSEAARSELAMIANTRSLEIPPAIAQFSSHRLLWELIEEELLDHPLIVERAEDYLTDRAGQLNITDDVLDRRAFVQELIIPAYQQGLARLLVKAGLPLALWGQGWEGLEEFAPLARGSLADRAAFDAAVAESAALVFCWPERAAHPIEMTGRPLVHRAGNDRGQFLRNAQRSLAGNPRRPPIEPHDRDSLARIVLAFIQSAK